MRSNISCVGWITWLKKTKSLKGVEFLNLTVKVKKPLKENLNGNYIWLSFVIKNPEEIKAFEKRFFKEGELVYVSGVLADVKKFDMKDGKKGIEIKVWLKDIESIKVFERKDDRYKFNEEEVFGKIINY